MTIISFIFVTIAVSLSLWYTCGYTSRMMSKYQFIGWLVDKERVVGYYLWFHKKNATFYISEREDATRLSKVEMKVAHGIEIELNGVEYTINLDK